MPRAIILETEKDLIAAPATPPGEAAIAIVRLSGEGAEEALGKLVREPLERLEPGRLVLTYLLDPESGEEIDQVLAVRWAAPRSYTGEDMAEFHLHGGSAVVARVLESCQKAGARLARPGEFTRRAFLNGKIDLSQAEAIGSLTRARTEEARRVSLNQLGGALSEVIDSVRKNLVMVAAQVEAMLDYPEEDIEAEALEAQEAPLFTAREALEQLVETSRRGLRLARGARLVFAGPPNAGKSSLFNAILRRERAIVSPHPGTTRDSIEATVDLAGIPLTLVDTAGLRANPDEIEAIGIRRSREEMESADLVAFIVDATDPAGAWEEYRLLGETPHFLLLNKADLIGDRDSMTRLEKEFAGPSRRQVLQLSVLRKQGVEKFEAAVVDFFGRHERSETGVIVTSSRHETALRRAIESLESCLDGIRTHQPPELISVDLTMALSQLDSITGRQGLDEDVLDLIFSTFCLGK